MVYLQHWLVTMVDRSCLLVRMCHLIYYYYYYLYFYVHYSISVAFTPSCTWVGYSKNQSLLYFGQITLCMELGIYKSTLMLHVSFLLSCALLGASVLGIHTPTPLLYLHFLSCVRALILHLSLLLSCAQCYQNQIVTG